MEVGILQLSLLLAFPLTLVVGDTVQDLLPGLKVHLALAAV